MKTIILFRIDHDDCKDIKSISVRVCNEDSSATEQYRMLQAKIEGVEPKWVEVLATCSLDEEWVGNNADRMALLEKLASISDSSADANRALNDLFSFVANEAHAHGVAYGYHDL